MSIINFLQEWYKSNCKSENSIGIQIETDSNSGWRVCIDLFDTDYENRDFKPIYIHKDNKNWVRCIKENQIFKGYGGSLNLQEILEIFYNWIIGY